MDTALLLYVNTISWLFSHNWCFCYTSNKQTNEQWARVHAGSAPCGTSSVHRVPDSPLHNPIICVCHTNTHDKQKLKPACSLLSVLKTTPQSRTNKSCDISTTVCGSILESECWVKADKTQWQPHGWGTRSIIKPSQTPPLRHQRLGWDLDRQLEPFN